jgi:hypothetical protein
LGGESSAVVVRAHWTAINATSPSAAARRIALRRGAGKALHAIWSNIRIIGDSLVCLASQDA